jgi:hypothetical protein
VVELYKQWYSEQIDKPLPDYIEEHWKEESTDTSEVATNAFYRLLGDPEQDLDDIINELFGKIEQLKTKQQ